MQQRLLVAVVLSVSGAYCQTVTSVVNGVSFGSPLSPGSPATIFGSLLAFPESTTTVTVAGIDCPVWSANSLRVNIHIPLNVPVGTATLTVRAGGRNSNAFGITLGSYAPALVTASGQASGLVAAYNTIGTLIDSLNPAHPGDTVTVYASGLGQTNPAAPPAGTTTPQFPIYQPLAQPTLSIGRLNVPISSSTLAPGYPTWTYQLTFQIPAGTPAGTPSLTLGAGQYDNAYQQVTIATGSACSFDVNPATFATGLFPGTGSFSLTASHPSCLWSAQSQAAWLTLTSAASGTGNATVSYSFTAAPTARSGAINIVTAGRTVASFTVSQSVAGGVPQTITTVPPAAGLEVLIDGQSVSSPVTVSWLAGTAHTIGITSPQSGSDGNLYYFQSWNDGGGLSHSIIGPAAPSTFTATFSTTPSSVAITSLNPPATSVGGPAFTLTVNGSGFASGSIVKWNGSALATGFVAPGVVTALVPDSLIAQAGTANITVQSGTSGSNTLQLPVQAGVRLSLATQVTFQLPRAGSMPVTVAPLSRAPVPRDTNTPTPITAGSNLTFQLQVSNTTPVDATQVTVASNLTPGLQFQSCATSTGGTCSAAGGTVTANVGSVPAYQSATVTIQAIAAANIAPGTNVAASSHVSSSEPDNADPNSFSPPLTVADPATPLIQVSRTTIPAGAGTVVSNPASVNDFYLAGTRIVYSAVPNPGYAFQSFGGDLSGTVNPAALTVTRAGMVAQANFGPFGMAFVPAVPCRIADTRLAKGPFGGPSIAAGKARDFAIPLSPCGIPNSATAYSLNVTVVPRGTLGYLTVWPAGQSQPFVSTLNSFDGRTKANAAIAPAGNNSFVSVYATDTTDVVLDIDGYFIPVAAGGASLAFYPLPPCRVADTRLSSASLGGPSLVAGQARVLPVQSSACGIPPNAQAYSLNMTVVPQGPLSYLTTWPAGQTQPFVSTLNAPTGTVAANAALVPAGSNGAIAVFATNSTDLVVDINGYFAPRGGSSALAFYPLAPCRVADTRLAIGAFGGPSLAAGQPRAFAIPASPCGVPPASAYSLNATVVPGPFLGFLTLWPAGGAQPLVSTLNAFDGAVTSNAAIVPAGAGSGIGSFVTDKADLILDTNGYFAP